MTMRFRFNPENPQVKGAAPGSQIAVGKNYYAVDAELVGEKLEPLSRPQGTQPPLLLKVGNTLTSHKPQRYESLSDPPPSAGPAVTKAPPELQSLTEDELKAALRKTGVNPNHAGSPQEQETVSKATDLDSPDDKSIFQEKTVVSDGPEGVDAALDVLKADVEKAFHGEQPSASNAESTLQVKNDSSAATLSPDVTALMDGNSKKELVEKLAALGLETSGSKTDLAQRLAEAKPKE